MTLIFSNKSNKKRIAFISIPFFYLHRARSEERQAISSLCSALMNFFFRTKIQTFGDFFSSFDGEKCRCMAIHDQDGAKKCKINEAICLVLSFFPGFVTC